MDPRLHQTLEAVDPTGARATTIQTPHGAIQTPIFMPVGTLGTVKTTSPDELKGLNAQIILGNTYHLYLRPGMEVFEKLGGLHRFMDWDRPILTDSGGYQFFSLRKNAKFKEEGVTFKSHLDGSRHQFTPERVVEIQRTIGSDIMMVLDHVLPLPAHERALEDAMDRTTRWAKRSLVAAKDANGALFAILQGGTSEALRKRHVEALCGEPFHGFAVGGLAVGEPPQDMYDTLNYVVPMLPQDKPRYLMGVGKPQDILEGIRHGIDMFDCVMPTRNARTAQVFTRRGVLNLRNAKHRLDDQPIDDQCGCLACTRFSRAYIRHLVKAGEVFGIRLTTLHNLTYYLDLVRGAREAILLGKFDNYARRCAEGWAQKIG